jgi:hypothetical protein
VIIAWASLPGTPVIVWGGWSLKNRLGTRIQEERAFPSSARISWAVMGAVMTKNKAITTAITFNWNIRVFEETRVEDKAPRLSCHRGTDRGADAQHHPLFMEAMFCFRSLTESLRIVYNFALL